MSIFPQIVNSTELAILAEALDRYCFQHDIKDEMVREDIARLVLVLFEGGAKTVAELTDELENRLRASDPRTMATLSTSVLAT
jgi:hypothetical protein